MQRSEMINFDLEHSPLQIRTNSEEGSNDKVAVWLKTAFGEEAGAVRFFFSSPPQYLLCSTSWTNFPTALPTETDKIWTVTLTKHLFVRHVVITCNDKKVVKVVMSDGGKCNNWYWGKFWEKNVEKIYFNSTSDTGSDYYRQGRFCNSNVKSKYSFYKFDQQHIITSV